MTTVARDKAALISKLCHEACEKILKENGFELENHGFAFGDRFEFKIRGIPSAINEMGMNPNKEEVKNFHSLGHYYGLAANALGAEFTFAGKSYCFMGLLASRKKFPFLVRDSKDKEVLLARTPEVVQAINDGAAAKADHAGAPAKATKPKAPR